MKDRLQEVVLLEPRPDHREIIQDVERTNMEACDSFLHRRRFERVDDLAFPGSRSCVED